MLKSIVGQTIELPIIKNLQENEKPCDICGGTGFMYNDRTDELVHCSNCYWGKVKVCPECNKEYKGLCDTTTCREKREQRKEQEAYDKAHKFESIDNVPAEMKEMLYSDVYKYCDGYFCDLDELYTYCADNGIDVPKYVWCTYCCNLHLCAEDILETACEELHEGAYDSLVDFEELQIYLDTWCKKQTGARTYYVDYKNLVLLD